MLYPRVLEGHESNIKVHAGPMLTYRVGSVLTVLRLV